MTSRIVFPAVLLLCAPAFAAKPCDELKGEIAARIEANHVPSYTLEIVDNDAVADKTVVGSCDGGTHKIVYARGAAANAAPGDGSAAPAPVPAPPPQSPPAAAPAQPEKK